jgi:ABC-type bacteriocin/lantibiotic exporter with double-glycine peptidase domain
LEELEREQYGENNSPVQNGEIIFSNVYFAYPNTDIDVLKDICVHIKDSEKIAVVGENGSGKSTFINLLCGMFDPRRIA